MESGVHESQGRVKPKEEVTVIAPNGASETFRYKPNERVEQLLREAVREFAKKGLIDPEVEYVLVLGDQPLQGHLTLEAAGVRPESTVKIRSRKIPGDGIAS